MKKEVECRHCGEMCKKPRRKTCNRCHSVYKNIPLEFRILKWNQLMQAIGLGLSMMWIIGNATVEILYTGDGVRWRVTDVKYGISCDDKSLPMAVMSLQAMVAGHKEFFGD